MGILQALSATGAVSLGAAIPIIMGQNIGTCITAILSSFGTNRNAKRAALVHLTFNIIGTVICLTVFTIVDFAVAPVIFDSSANAANIAVFHSIFNIACTVILLPMSGLLEKIAYTLVPEGKQPEKVAELDERLFATPSIAIEKCGELAADMARGAVDALKDSLECLREYSPELAEKIRDAEEKSDHYEDIIGTYLVKLSEYQMRIEDRAESAKLLKIIGDLERISDYAVGLVKASEEMKDKNMKFSDEAIAELNNLCDAIDEILSYTLTAFSEDNIVVAQMVEPLEQVIDVLKEKLRSGHIRRLQQGACSIETGFVWSDILTNLARTSDHCSNIAGCIIDAAEENLNLHQSLRAMKNDDPAFKAKYAEFETKYFAKV